MPEVLNVFKIIIDFIHDVLQIRIHMGNGYYINLWWVYAFVVMLVLILNFLTLENRMRMRAEMAESFTSQKAKRQYNRYMHSKRNRLGYGGGKKYGTGFTARNNK